MSCLLAEYTVIRWSDLPVRPWVDFFDLGVTAITAVGIVVVLMLMVRTRRGRGR